MTKVWSAASTTAWRVYPYYGERGRVCARRPVGIWPALLAAALVTLLQWLFTALPMMQKLFGTVALDAQGWLLAAGAALVVVIVVELDKYLVAWIRRRRAASL